MKIINRTKTIQVFNIPCRPNCDGTDCFCSQVQTHLNVQDKDGTSGRKILDRRLPGSLTLLASETKTKMPDWVGETAPIKDAVAKNILRLVKE